MQGSPARRRKPQLPSCTARAHQSPCLLFICRPQSTSLHSRHILGSNQLLLSGRCPLPQASFGEFSGFGPCSGPGALPQDSKPKYAYYRYQIKCKGELVKLCFINKVREEHDQIINRFGTGATRLANHPNEHNAYIYTTDTACLPPSSDSFPASLLHPNSSPLIYFIPHQGRGSSLGSGHVPGPEPSPRTASQNMLTIAIRLNVRVNS